MVAECRPQACEHARVARLVQSLDERGGVLELAALDREEGFRLVDALEKRQCVAPAQPPPRLLQDIGRDAFFAGDVLDTRQREHRQQRRVDVSLLGAQRARPFEIVPRGVEPVAFEMHDPAHVPGRDREPEFGIGNPAGGVERVVGERLGFREPAFGQCDLAEHAGHGDAVGCMVQIHACHELEQRLSRARGGPSMTEVAPPRRARGTHPRTSRIGRATHGRAALGARP